MSSALPISQRMLCVAGERAVSTALSDHQPYTGTQRFGVQHPLFPFTPPSPPPLSIDSNASEVSRISRLLSLAVVSSLSPWDLAVASARLQVQLGVEFVRQVMEHFCVDYELRAATLKQLVVTHFFTACSMLHM